MGLLGRRTIGPEPNTDILELVSSQLQVNESKMHLSNWILIIFNDMIGAY